MAIVEAPPVCRGAGVPPSDSDARDAVAAIQEVYGRHRGFRVAHAPGIVCSGIFVPTEEGRKIGTAHHMQNDVAVKVRFSNASGDPGVPDWAQDAYGMATRFYLGENWTDIVAVTLPCFFVCDAASFVELNGTSLRVGNGRRPWPRPVKLMRFYRSHPEARVAIRASIRLPAVPSYANCRYNALHAFKWTGPDGAENYVRYSWIPEEGERTIKRRNARTRPRDYLREAIYDRLGREPVRPIRFMLQLQVATLREIDHGLVCDPTAVWPDDLQRVDVGLLELTGLEEEEPNHEETLAFDPTTVTDGIEVPSLNDGQGDTYDEILALRHIAYGISARMRANP
jgi:catalase